MNYNDLTFEKLGDNIEICISTEHRFGTDAFLLADFAKPRHKDKVCDFCTGSGIVALLMYKNFQPAHIYALEIQEKAHDQLKMSLERSEIVTITPVLGDLKEWRAENELDLITCNPPYKIDNTGAKNDLEAISIARHEMMCTIDDVCKSAAKNLKFGGRLCVCNRPQRLCDIMIAMRSSGIEPKRVRFVSKNPKTAPWLVLVEGRKGGNPFLQVEPQFYTQNENGGFSDELKELYSQPDNKQLFSNLDKLHTTDSGIERIKKNLSLTTDDVVNWCREKIKSPKAQISRKGKNWYISENDCVITVNANSFTIITAHKIRNSEELK